MGTSGLRERNKARTREEIIEAALGLFEERGYDATRCEDIAAAADVSVRTFFRYFDTKLDVVMATTGDERPGETFIAELLSRPPAEGPVTAFGNMMRAPIVEFELGRTLEVRQILLMLTTPGLESLLLEHFRRIESVLVGAIATRLNRPADDLDAWLLAAALCAAMRIAFVHWANSAAQPGALWPLLHERLDRLEHGFASLHPA